MLQSYICLKHLLPVLPGGPVNWPLNEFINVNDIRCIQLIVLTSVVIKLLIVVKI